ncbi:YciI family protein [Phenylobacterium deserti]|uniref:YciI family protein n=1 Tax=Phenylobacterium deserti TaxID=1914756 RepID=A0A328ASD2_9CAUL|nr:YciI family protein [Phenylobacterium deserti]RAK57171.1 YciI family protein [Phenylobacterium deserti]
MPLFVLTCLDKPNALEVRLGAREAHLAYVAERGVLKLGGPFLNEAGDMAGSLMIIETADLKAAREFNANDPYTKAGLFESVEIRPFRVTIGSL